MQNKVSSAQTKANIKMQVYQGAGKGLTAIPKGLQESMQQKGQAEKSIMDAESQQSGASYDSVKSTLRGFLDVDYFAGLVTVANIQLR